MFSSSISRLSFAGMVMVSLISIVMIGGAWIGWMLYDFNVEADQLRATHYADQKELVRSEVEKGIRTLQAIREDGLRDIWNRIRHRGHHAQAMARVLAAGEAKSDMNRVMSNMAKVMRSPNPNHEELYLSIGKTTFLISPFPKSMDKGEILLQLDEALSTLEGGERQVVVSSTDGQKCTVLLQIMTLRDLSWRIVSGICLEVAEEETKRRVIKQLESARFGSDGYLFGGTWRGLSVLGPAKGKNVWSVTDAEGVKIVQRLVAVAKNGGGFVSYVMPNLTRNRSSEKVSYAMPVPEWQWYIGAGLYVDDIEEFIDQSRAELKTDIYDKIGVTLLILCGLSLVAFAVSKHFSSEIRTNMVEFTDVWNRATSSGTLVDPGRLKFQEFKELADAANRMVVGRLEAESAAKVSADSFLALVRNIPGAVYQQEWNENKTIVFVSASIKEITGYPVADFMEQRRTLESLVESGDFNWLMQTVEEAVRSHETFTLEYRIRRADNQIRWVFEQGQAQYDEDGSPKLVSGVIIDITDKRKAEEDHYSHLHFLRTMENLDNDIRRHDDLDTMLSEVVETLRKAFGADRGWLLHPCDPNVEGFTVPVERTNEKYPGAGVRKQEVPIDQDISNVFRNALESSGPVPYDGMSGYDVPESVARNFNVQSQLVAAVYPRIGEPWLLGIHVCRAHRKWTPEDMQLFKEASRRIADALSNTLIMRELRSSEEKFRTFSEQSMLGICVLQDDIVKFANKAFCDIFEVSIEDMLNLPTGGFVQFIHPDDQAFLLEQADKKQSGASGQVSSYTWRAITSSGRVRWVQVHSKTVTMHGRSANLMTLQDITEAKRFREDLEGLVMERTADLAARKAELEEANARLTMLDDLKSSFLTTVSHDMRTPLTSILGYSRLVRRDLEKILNSPAYIDENANDRLLENMSVMEGETRRLNSLIDEFMDLTAIKAGTAVWNDAVVDPSEAIQRAANHCASLAGAKTDVRFELDMQDQLLPMVIDVVRLEQVVFALMNNGLKFTTQGSVVTTVRNDVDGGMILTVEDTGKGLSEKDIEVVFEPFHQVELGDTLVDDIKGSGLGLTLCHGIVEHYGGSVRVESVPGEGSAFTVYLPPMKST